MNLTKCSSLLAFVCIVHVAINAQTEPGIRLDPSAYAADVTFVKFEHGFFSNFDIPPTTGTSTAVHVYNRAGRRVLQLAVSVPQAIETGVTDVAFSGDGRIAVSGGATAADSQSTGMIAFFDSKGNGLSIVRTATFVPLKISFAEDGTLWALGYELDANGRLPSYSMLRQYSSAGTLAQSALLNSAVSVDKRVSPANGAQLAVSGGVVAVYARSENMFVEISSQTGEIMQQFSGPSRSACTVRHFGRTKSGSLFATCESRSSTGIYKFETQSKQWKPVSGLSGTIVGTDGEQVVLWTPAQSVIWTQGL